MQKNIEIEIRGPLTKQTYEDLVSLFEKEGKKITTKDRILIDYSTFLEGGIEHRKKDIRLRITNGIPEIIVKMGEWGGTDKRKELSVITQTGSFDTLVEIFAALGYSKGVLCVRKSAVYEYEGVEFALVEVPGHSFYYEAEKMAAEHEDATLISDDIANTCKKLGLDVYDKQGFFDYIQELNTNANEIFEFDPQNTEYFKTRFGL